MSKTKIRKNSCFTSVRNNEEQVDDLEALRIMTNCFNNHIKKFIKRNKKCLGDIEDLCKANSIKQQQILTPENKEKLFVTFLQRMKKDMNTRNSSIIKNISQYESQYHDYLKPFKQVTPTIQNDSIKLLQPQICYQKISTKNIKRIIRPTTSITTRFRNKVTSIHQTRFNSTTLSNNATNLSLFQQFSKQKNTSETCRRKYSIITTNRQRVKSQVIQNSDISVSDIISENNIFNDSKISYKQNKYCFKNRSCNKQSIDINPGINLQQREKRQLKNKILMLNSGLAINLAKPQGYKPKSQYWNKYYL